MIGYQQGLLEDNNGAYNIDLSNNGMYIELRMSECGIPHYLVGFGPTEYRGFAYISAFEPKYISDVDSMLSETYRDQFATTIQTNWAFLKTNEYWKDHLPNIIPNYFELKAQKSWKHNSIDKNIVYNNTMYAHIIYKDELLNFSVYIVESSAYPDIIYFQVHTKEGDVYIDAINFYYLTEDTLNCTYEYDFKRVIYANWDKILKINNKVLDHCPNGILYDPLTERY